MFARHKCIALVVITFINNVTSILTLLIFIQSGKIGSSEEFELSDDDHEDDNSHNTPPQVDEAANPLFNPTFSLPTQVTGDSHTSGGWALNIVHFFVTYGKDEKKKQVCKICG
jgi:hypothetical protein